MDLDQQIKTQILMVASQLGAVSTKIRPLKRFPIPLSFELNYSENNCDYNI